MDGMKPGRWYYGLALLVFLLGEAVIISSLFSSFGDLSDSSIRMVAPGSTSLNLAEAGKYTIFYESLDVAADVYNEGEVPGPGLDIDLRNASTGLEIPHAPPLWDYSYEINGRYGRSLLEFEIYQPGRYNLSARYPEGQEGPEATIFVKRGFSEDFRSEVIKVIALSLASPALALAIALFAYRKRKRWDEQMEAEKRMGRWR